MADTKETTAGESPSSQPWSDADHVPALKRLQDVQNQIDKLRTALPSIIAPLALQQNSPPLSTVSPHQVYTEFASKAVQAMKDVATLRELWQDQETKRILQHAEDSLETASEVSWEFVKMGRFGEIPEDDTTLDVEMKTEGPDQVAETSREAKDAGA